MQYWHCRSASLNSDHEKAHSSYNERGKGDCGQLVATKLQSIDLMSIVPGPKYLTNKVSEELSQILIPYDLILKTNQNVVAYSVLEQYY